MRTKIKKYKKTWKRRGYAPDLPDEVPEPLLRLQLAPSYKAIALAILKNDHSMKSLGFTPKKSEWYNRLKRIEIANRNSKNVSKI